MSITIQLERSLEKKIREAAEQRGLPLEKQVSEILERFFRPGPAAEKTLPRREAVLLEKANLAILPETWAKYRSLIAKKDSETISENELETLLTITDEIELANAERIGHLVELAQIRRIPLATLMEQLGLRPISHE